MTTSPWCTEIQLNTYCRIFAEYYHDCIAHYLDFAVILGTAYHVLLWHAGTLRLCSYHTHQQFVFTMVKSMVATIPVGIDVRAPPKWRGIPHNNVFFSHHIRKNNYELKHVVSLNVSSITSHVTFTSQPFTYPGFPGSWRRAFWASNLKNEAQGEVELSETSWFWCCGYNNSLSVYTLQ